MIETPAPERLDGTLTFIRYAFMPNRLGYCGGDDNRTLLQHASEGVSEPDLVTMLRRFTGALPYLRLIATSNGIADPFDARVVEAYWLGNALLEGVQVRRLYDSLLERAGKHLTGRPREVLLGKVPEGALPHHSFHVLDVHSRIGEQGQSLEVMDHCRISWAEVNGVDGAQLIVSRRPLVLLEGQLSLGQPRTERVLRQVDGAGFADSACVGDSVSVHWGWVCEVIGHGQRQALERYTRRHLAIANRTI